MKKYPYDRIGQLITLLSEANSPLSSHEICKKLLIKPRTLRNDLSCYKDLLYKSGMEVNACPGKGYQLIIFDSDKYHFFMKEIANSQYRHHYNTPIDFQQRVEYIVRFLLSTQCYSKLDDLAEEIFISRSSLNKCMKEVRNILKSFNLDLKIKTAQGVKVTGDELNIRQAIAKYFFYETDCIELNDGKPKTVRKKIASVLNKVLASSQLQLTDTGFQNLVIHIEIAIMRIENYHGNIELPISYSALKKRDEYSIAERIVRELEQALSITFPEPERYFIAIHLAGKRSLHYQAFILSHDAGYLFDKVCQRIKESFSLDLMDDFELFHLLSLHVIPMIDRLKWGLKVNNPLLEEIKMENPKAYEIAAIAGKVIQQETGLLINEEEIGYLAIHFALALERKETSRQRYNLIIVCASGMGSSQLLLNKIRQRFADSIGQTKVLQLYELTDYDLAHYDLIISTVDIPFKTALPSIRVNYFFGDGDINRVAGWFSKKQPPSCSVSHYFSQELFFTDIQSTERYQLLKELCQRVAERMPVGPDFFANVAEREKLSATAFGNAIAFPHPLQPCGDKTFVAVALLNKPVSWDRHDVRYIFMLNIRKGEKEPLQRLHESLISLLDNSRKLTALDSCPTFAMLMKLLSGNTLPPQH